MIGGDSLVSVKHYISEGEEFVEVYDNESDMGVIIHGRDLPALIAALQALLPPSRVPKDRP